MKDSNKNKISKVTNAVGIAESVHGLATSITTGDYISACFHGVKLVIAGVMMIKSIKPKPKIGKDDDFDDGAPSA